MNQTQRELWFSDVKTELKEWSRKSLLIWAACLFGSLLFVYLAFAALNGTQQAFVNSDIRAPGATDVTSDIESEAPVDTVSQSDELANEPQELVIVDSQPQPNDRNLKRISETALSLHSHLQSGSESEASFWRPISESIAALEQGVRLGDIDSVTATWLITELRARYVDLRTGSNTADDFAADSQSAVALEPTTTDADFEQAAATIEEGFDAGETTAIQTLPLALRLLPWLSLLLPIACLLFGVHALLKRMRERHEGTPRKGYEKLAGSRQAQAMTAQVVPENRHAAERKTQAAILQLLDEMEPLSEGDLTHEASVTEDLTGALADSFNHAVHELRRLVKQINRSTVMVRTAVADSRERTLLMARQGAVQAREVSRTNDRIEGMQTEVVSLSVTSQEVAKYAQKVAKRTQQAAHSVTETRDALAAIRARADVAERSMHRLVQSTKGIESRLSDIKTAAKRTDLLALNSTIHAASLPSSSPELVLDSTGGYALGNTETFSELASDVASLSDQLKSATNDIDQLSDVIRDEANDSLRAVHETVSQVKACESLSQDAKQHLDDIARAANALGKAVTDISQRASLQAQGVTDIANTTQVINSITHDSATALTQAVQDLQNLENMSNSLEASVHGFRLPEEPVS